MLFNEEVLKDLVGACNRRLQNLKSKEKISDKQLKYFTYEFKKATNLSKLYLLTTIHKRLSNVPGRLQYPIVEHHWKMLLSFWIIA